MNEEVKKLEYKIVDDLKPGLRSLNIKIKCISKNPERKVVSRGNGKSSRVSDALVGDSTGCIYLTLWDDDIDKMKLEHIYKLTSVFTKVYRG
ncbi:MAG: DNA-binding protein [Candidatus Helarchaeota archaeon]